MVAFVNLTPLGLVVFDRSGDATRTGLAGTARQFARLIQALASLGQLPLLQWQQAQVAAGIALPTAVAHVLGHLVMAPAGHRGPGSLPTTVGSK